jgi:hypothetical protein
LTPILPYRRGSAYPELTLNWLVKLVRTLIAYFRQDLESYLWKRHAFPSPLRFVEC